ncbi:MAG: DUF4173 domain-containing protein [Devosia sp.]
MTDIAGTTAPTEPTIWNARTFAAAAILAALIVAGDILLWNQQPGISLFIFFCCLIAGVLALHPQRFGEGRTVILFLVALLSVVPFIETLSPWALLTAQGGLTLLVLGISSQLPRFEDWGGAFTRFGVLAPVRLIGDGFRAIGEGGRRKVGGRFLRAAAVWLVPLFFAAVFALLFSAANPVVEMGLRAIRLDKLLDLLDPARIFIWGFVAVSAWPFLVPKLLNWTPLPQMQGPALPRAEGLLFGHDAIRNSLIVFNAMFALQTAMDLMFLWGGVRLPDGMSHAEYAHRGAYPLIVTAILAGAFVLAAMRRNGPGETSPLIRNLVYLWIAQNIWLVISSLLRLKLYVEEFHLSEMRVAAGIWMILVAIGLALIVARIALNRPNKWLVMCNLAALSLTFWIAAVIDIKSVIAFYNVRHAYEVTGHGVRLDYYYMSELGPAAIPALDEYLTTAKLPNSDMSILRQELASRVIYANFATKDVHPFAEDWREWTWRSDRLQQYLLQHPFSPDAAALIE